MIEVRAHHHVLAAQGRVLEDQHAAHRRTGRGGALYRLPTQTTQIDLGLYPNGYLPFINSTVDDTSLITGVRGRVLGFQADLSNTYGRNSLRYDISNSVNASLPQGPGIRNQTEGGIIQSLTVPDYAKTQVSFATPRVYRARTARAPPPGLRRT